VEIQLHSCEAVRQSLPQCYVAVSMFFVRLLQQYYCGSQIAVDAAVSG